MPACRYNDLARAGAQARGSGPAALAAADDFVTRRYGQARAAGLNLVRMFATQGDNSTNLALETRPGMQSVRKLACDIPAMPLLADLHSRHTSRCAASNLQHHREGTHF